MDLITSLLKFNGHEILYLLLIVIAIIRPLLLHQLIVKLMNPLFHQAYRKPIVSFKEHHK